MHWLTLVAGLVIGVSLGNFSGDQATLRDCASEGTAKMAGGGTINCAVAKRETN